MLDTGPARLIAIAGSQAGRKFKIGDHAVIGRSSEASVTLEDPEVSRSHARVSKSDLGAYLLEDLGSKNGTRVGPVVVTGPTPVRSGDEIHLGSAVVTIHASASALTTETVERPL